MKDKCFDNNKKIINDLDFHILEVVKIVQLTNNSQELVLIPIWAR